MNIANGNRDKTIIDILKSIDESLKILAGRKQQSKPAVQKTYKDFYFAKTENKWEEKNKHDNEANT